VHHPRTWVLVCSLLVMAACTSDGSTTTDSSEPPLISVLPQSCGSVSLPPEAAEVTFVANGQLYSTQPDGSGIRCIEDLPEEGTDMGWGGQGDRVAFDTPSGGLVLLDGDEHTFQPSDPDPTFQGLSRPVGTSLVYISGDGRRLFKVPVDGGPEEDISFLKRHDEVVYHPSGTSVIAVGEDRAGIYGVFFATNEGTDVRLLAVGEDAKRIYSLAFSHDGRTLYYAAEHEDRYDLHSLALTDKKKQESDEAAAEERLRTLHSSEQPIDNVVVSEFTRRPPVAFTEGDCENGRRTSIWDHGAIEKVAGGDGRFSTPSGWLPDGTLAVTTSAEGCGEPGTVSLWTGGKSQALVADVSDAAIRSQLPAPPRPLIPAEGVVP
jgi:hypothetical protein